MYVQGGNKTKVKSFVTLDTLRKEGFNMKIFKAYVINKDTKKGLFIESEYKKKRDFINLFQIYVQLRYHRFHRCCGSYRFLHRPLDVCRLLL